jgi:microcystin synthetase protein McyA
VVIDHRNAVALIDWARNLYPREELAGVLASTSVCFDLSIFEIFVPLSSGGTVIMAENALHLPSLPAAGKVTLINTVPSAIAELARLRAIPDSVRSINLAGEPLNAELPGLIFSNSRAATIRNLYGPTEDTTYSTCARITRGEPWSPVIGRPLDNRKSYILDSHLQPAPIGVTGELYLGGEGVARGYLNRPELTAERFLESPFVSGDRLYKTGDLARYRPDGNIEYLGRMDGQVKLRGYRIEPGEIESALRRCEGVRDAAVLVRENAAGERFLAAWIVPENSPVSSAEIRSALQLSLPHYMIPVVFAPLAGFPMTPNGKLDRAALPNAEPSPAPTRVFPRGDMEQSIAAIWSNVLGIREPGIDDNFFDLGGHSLLLLRVQARIQESIAEVSIVDLFRYPSIRALSAHLTGHGKQEPGDGFMAARQRARRQRERAGVREAVRSS